MPSWNQILEELRIAGSTHDLIRRKYLSALYKLTNRNTIIYYSGWLQKGGLEQKIGRIGFSIDEVDKTGFMAAVYELDRSKGLDLFLHTPGGETASTESIVDYLRNMFNLDIRVIVPQIAMSAGTMIALSAKEIVMGKHSSLGPIDPQIGGIAAHGILEEYTQAKKEIAANGSSIPLWQMIFNKYTPTLIGECEKAIKLTEEMIKRWLTTGMFAGDENGEEKANEIYRKLGDHALTMAHDRRIPIEALKNIGVKVSVLEDNQDFQELVMAIHHTTMLTLEQTQAYKIIENHNGIAYIRQIRQLIIGN
jgi:ClpP class serine protease